MTVATPPDTRKREPLQTQAAIVATPDIRRRQKKNPNNDSGYTWWH